jgi:hypothetical protein
MVEEE